MNVLLWILVVVAVLNTICVASGSLKQPLTTEARVIDSIFVAALGVWAAVLLAQR